LLISIFLSEYRRRLRGAFFFLEEEEINGTVMATNAMSKNKPITEINDPACWEM
jgi:hypothetical protein